MAAGYKKYMKKTETKDFGLLKLFAISFFGMLLIFTFLIKVLSPSVDVSIGGDRVESEIDTVEDSKNNVDGRLSMIQDEDRGRDFSELMKNAVDVPPVVEQKVVEQKVVETPKEEVVSVQPKQPVAEPVYKVFIGTYTSAEQAKVARDIIVEGGAPLTPMVKCIGSNNYTLQVGIFKSKLSAEGLLSTVQQNHLPGRIVQEY